MHNLPDPERQPQFYTSVPMKRLLAFAIDTGVVALICAVIIPFTAFTAFFFLPFLFGAVSFVYRTVTLANGSATWGMRFAAIELRTGDGERLDAGTAALHTAGFMVSMMMPLLQVISIVMMLTSARGQGLSDMVLGTVALNRRAVA